ncbi:hypothetical protein SAMN05428988_1302 [Chitinophaga sp. YR573]|nr:hypothetical protein SAMN05428988_1302 [Chitinophaga sp. YR573]
MVKWLLPPALRQPEQMAGLNALVSPINDLHTRLIYYRANAIYRLGITSQVVHLERALNDRYDVVERRIYITDGVEMNALPLFLKSENKPVKLFKKSEGIPVILYTKAETSIFSADFIVNVPVLITFDMAEMTAFVNGYKLASKTFKIKTHE